MPSPVAGSAIQYKTLAQMVQIQLDYIIANAPVLLKAPLGPFVTAVAYAVGMVGMVIQRLVQLALVAARLSTASGSDVDSFVADFGLIRLPATAAVGVVTFSRFTPAPSLITIPTGTLVQTTSNPPVQFQVVTPSNVSTPTQAGSTTGQLIVQSTYGMYVGDVVAVAGFNFVSGTPTISALTTVGGQPAISLNGVLNLAPGTGVLVTDTSTNPNFSPTTGSYQIAAGQSSVNATVQALTLGTGGNVAINTVTQIAGPLAGVDLVNNGIAFTNAENVETDSQLQARFALFILGLSKATKLAIASAVTAVQQGLFYYISEPAKFARTSTTGSSSTVTSLNVSSTAGMSVGDPVLVDGIPFLSGPGTIAASGFNSTTIPLNGTLASPPAAGVGVTDPVGVGTPDGTFTVAVDDGSGSIPQSTVSTIAAQVELVRPAGVRAIVIPTATIKVAAVARVMTPANRINIINFLTFQQIVISSVLQYINTLQPGAQLHYATLYRQIFNATSPGDAVSTTIAQAPTSTAQVIQVLSTTGYQVGQLLQVGNLLTAGGAYPTILSIDNQTQITLTTPLTMAPSFGTLVIGFTVAPDQILDIHALQLSTIAFSGSPSAITAGTLPSTGGTFTVPTTTGLVANQYLIITDEATSPPTYYQAPPGLGLLPQVGTVGSPTTITTPIGVLNAGGVFTLRAPPAQTTTKIVALAAGSLDIRPAFVSAVRMLGSGPNSLLIQIESEQP